MGYPDCNYIREKVPIQAVAHEVGIVVTSDGKRGHCWRPQNHRNGDRDPSVGFWLKKNKGRCFVCDTHAWSAIDLVMMVLGIGTKQAIQWIASRFDVPEARRGNHIGERQGWTSPFRVGTSRCNLEALVRCGLWAELSAAHRSILCVLDVFTDPDSGVVEMSYRGLMRYSGVGSQTTIASAITTFVRLHMLKLHASALRGLLRGCNRYELTLDDPAFLNILTEIHHRHRKEIEAERQLRTEDRQRRSQQRARTAGKPTRASYVGI